MLLVNIHIELQSQFLTLKNVQKSVKTEKRGNQSHYTFKKLSRDIGPGNVMIDYIYTYKQFKQNTEYFEQQGLNA